MTITDLIKKLKTYLPFNDINIIKKAYQFSVIAHENQFRESGEAYVTHPLEVSSILSYLKADRDTIVAALLHDVVEDTKYTSENIEAKFGKNVRLIVDGVTKVALFSKPDITKSERQIYNFHKLALAMASDFRIILVKLADRLHNIRTLDNVPKDKQVRIAKETSEIYVPIAQKLGMHDIFHELENASFKYYYPLRYSIVKKAIDIAEEQNKSFIITVQSVLNKALIKHNILNAIVDGRKKTPASVYNKIIKYQNSLDISKKEKGFFYEIKDIYAFRILVSNVMECYLTLGIVHSIYKPYQGRLKDYIANPKPNGYQSLHTSLISDNGLPIEVQIRTKEMHNFIDKGIAAHWIYKDNAQPNQQSYLSIKSWLTNINYISNNSDDSFDFLQNTKLSFHDKEIFVMTPDGDIINLPIQSTVVDFAYSIHTNIGNNCISATINNQPVILSTELQTGDIIKIITNKNSKPKPRWLKFVKTPKAYMNIKHSLRKSTADQITIGKAMLHNALDAFSVDFNQEAQEDFTEFARKKFNIKSKSEFLRQIGIGNISSFSLVYNFINNQLEEGVARKKFLIGPNSKVKYNLANCCKPILGDEIIGKALQNSITVHRTGCKIVNQKKKNTDELLELDWENSTKDDFLTEFQIITEIFDRVYMSRFANQINNTDAILDNISNNIIEDSQLGVIKVGCYVKNRDHLAKIILRLRHNKEVLQVVRSSA